VSVLRLIVCTLLGISLMNSSFRSILDLRFCRSYLRSILIFLTLTLALLCLITTPYEKDGPYVLLLLSLIFVLVACFSVRNVIMFYVCFEASLIPTLLLIIGWGYQPERIQAGTYIILYTVAASLPLLLLLLKSISEVGSSNILLMQDRAYTVPGGLVIFLLIAFLVKLPIYRVHLWLPKAHVEAPLVGSMILAGILLKLGGYGLYLMSFIFSSSYKYCVIYLIISTRVWGGLVVTFMCLRQIDIKALVAYSSVRHIAIVSGGLILNTS